LADQRVDQHAATVEEDVLARLRLQRAHLLDHVAADDRRVAPQRRVGQGRRDDILLDAVQHIAERVARGQRLEGGAMSLPGLAPEQHGIGLTHGLKKVRADVVVPIGLRPAALRKAAVEVFVRAAGRLNDAVEGHEFGHDQVSHTFLLLA
jgi:hypothetical protein